jgi:hypothetical protein
MPSDALSTNHMPPLCIGHSHLRCVQAAALETGTALQAINFWDDSSVILNSPEDPVLTVELQGKVQANPGTVFSFVGGGAHTVIALASHPRRYDFVLPESPDLPVDSRAELVPVDAVRAVLEREAVPYLKLMRHLRSLARERLVHVEPPPPCPDNDAISPHMPWSLFPGMLQEVAPPWLRYKAWRLHSKIVADWCALNDIAFLPIPGGAADAAGFLKQEYFQDGVHANAAYGQLLLTQMQEAA